MKVYQEREKITLAFSTRGRKKYVEVKFGGDDIRLVVVERTRRAVRQQQGIPASRLLRSFGFFRAICRTGFH